mmetsp:Transcript_29867/g.75173  ORF Transcript_29867/g.75173 Transcript_29867/m.75173 type:complete len:255 (+) Transcript_29867:77-841(+)
MLEASSDTGCQVSRQVGGDSRDSLQVQAVVESPRGFALSSQHVARAGSAADAALQHDETEEGHEVWLHVYDLGPVTGKLNEFILKGANLGAFHCGVEVLGDEWSFQGFHDAWDDDTLPGIFNNHPAMHPDFIYRESVCLGRTRLSEEAIDFVLDSMTESWPANSYHVVSRNCVTFAEEFTKALQVPEPFPGWVRGAIDAGKQPTLFAIADYGWSWFKWYCQKQAESEAEPVEQKDPWGRPIPKEHLQKGEAKPA